MLMSNSSIDSIDNLNYNIDNKFIKNIIVLFENASLRNKIADLCHDPRIDISTWRVIFYREITCLLQWALNKIKKHKGVLYLPNVHNRISTVLSLLPSHGIAIHLLRRAILFAACGIVTEVGFSPTTMKDGAHITHTLATAFNLEQFLFCSSLSCEAKVNRIKNNNDNLTLVTGKINTVRMIQETIKGYFLGCAGRCAIVVSDTQENLLYIQQLLVKHNKPLSCTRLKAAFYIDGDNMRALTSDNVYHISNGEFSRHVSQLHPSCILMFDMHNQLEYFTQDDYIVIPIDENAALDNLIGFAKDPVYGWPGDYSL